MSTKKIVLISVVSILALALLVCGILLLVFRDAISPPEERQFSDFPDCGDVTADNITSIVAYISKGQEIGKPYSIEHRINDRVAIREIVKLLSNSEFKYLEDATHINPGSFGYRIRLIKADGTETEIYTRDMADKFGNRYLCLNNGELKTFIYNHYKENK